MGRPAGGHATPALHVGMTRHGLVRLSRHANLPLFDMATLGARLGRHNGSNEVDARVAAQTGTSYVIPRDGGWGELLLGLHMARSVYGWESAGWPHEPKSSNFI